jgi:thiol-disulfide isomerase/thioredoxin
MKDKNLERTEDDIDAALESKPKVYALFYASWCPHSRHFLPFFKEYAKSNPQDCLEVLVDFREDLCDKYSIEYYPTVLLLKNGKIQKRLDVEPGSDLTKEQLEELTRSK